MTEARTTRELQSRAKTEQRPTSWAPPEVLPTPSEHPDWVFRWVRTAMLGQADAMNVSARMREGWEPCKIADHPELALHVFGGDGSGNIEVGGLMLCRIPRSFMEQRAKHYANVTQQQMTSVDSNYMRENDPRMPVFAERKSKTSFGRGG